MKIDFATYLTSWTVSTVYKVDTRRQWLKRCNEQSCMRCAISMDTLELLYNFYIIMCVATRHIQNSFYLAVVTIFYLIIAIKKSIIFTGWGDWPHAQLPTWRARVFCQGVLPLATISIPLFGRRQIHAFCRCRSAAVQLHYQGYDEDMRQPTWWQSL